MKKISIASILAPCFVIMCVFANSVMAQERWEKTATLSSGEVVLDISGEWDVQYEGYGIFKWVGTMSDILTITREGKAFVAVKQIGSKWVPKGAKTIKGELSKDGFKAIYQYIGSRAMDGNFGWVESKWEIHENGNKVMIDSGGRMKATLTRK